MPLFSKCLTPNPLAGSFRPFVAGLISTDDTVAASHNKSGRKYQPDVLFGTDPTDGTDEIGGPMGPVGGWDAGSAGWQPERAEAGR
jgi:hypothetical protein